MQVPLVVRLSVMHMAYAFGAVCPESQVKPSILVIPCTHASQVRSLAFAQSGVHWIDPMLFARS